MSEVSLEEFQMGEISRLEELVDQRSLKDLVTSFVELFRLPIRVFSEQGTLLSGNVKQSELDEYLSQDPIGKVKVREIIELIREASTKRVPEVVLCFSGARYLVVPIMVDGRRLGRYIMGPYLDSDLKEVPPTLVEAAASLEPAQVRELLLKMPRAGSKTVSQIAQHLSTTLDLILFNGQKALLTSNMHLASVRESFRDLQETNAELTKAYEGLKELDRLKSNFLATVSHELRTPLTSIIGYSEMLKEGLAGPIEGEQREFVETIHEKGHQLLELITGLLDLTKLDSGTLSMEKHEVEAKDLLADVVSTLAPTAFKRQVTLNAKADSAIPALYADPVRLRQVLLNLTENALKFTPSGGTVELSARLVQIARDPAEDGDGHVLMAARQTALELRVADSGIGIPDEEKEKIFAAFYQVDSSSTREAGGTGLGLSIVKRILEAHRGQVRVENNQPRGTVMVVTIPYRKGTLS